MSGTARTPAAAEQETPLLDRISRTAFGTYQTAVVRIAISGIWLAVLIREFPNRHQIWGPDAPWGFEQASRTLGETGGFSYFGWNSGGAWFELCYLLALFATGCVLLGWRTRPMTILFALSVMSFQHRNEYVLNAGENIIRITAIYLIFTSCAQVWSLDARNRARRAAGSDHTATALWALLGAALGAVTAIGYPSTTWAVLLWSAWALYGALWHLRRNGSPGLRLLLDRLTALLHNGALVVIMVQVCLIYAAAGWYKVQGSLWQDGTAVYWSMNIGFLNPWPELTELMTANSGMVLLLTYATVMVQVAFPFSLLNRRVKNVLLAVLILEHLGIGLLMGLPFFSMAMIAIDLVFLPTSFLRRIEREAVRLRDRLRGTGPKTASAADREPGRGDQPERPDRADQTGQPDQPDQPAVAGTGAPPATGEPLAAPRGPE